MQFYLLLIVKAVAINIHHCRATAWEGCAWQFGDGNGRYGFEKSIGTISEPKECVTRCQKYNYKGQKPNGATVDTLTAGSCYCEFRMTWIQSARQKEYKTCRIAPAPECKEKPMGKEYRGTLSVTTSGLICQAWESQTPHEHNFTASLVPEDGLDKNYCRNPDDDENGPWCFTMEKTISWEYCPVRLCQDQQPIPALVRPSSLVNSEYCGMRSVERVVGGQATKQGAWPWMVSLVMKGDMNTGYSRCGASLLTDEWVLSAAHCIFDDSSERIPPSKFMVIIGEHHLMNKGAEIDINIDRIIIHENFSHITYDNDIALMHLTKRIEFTPTMRPVCIPDQGESFAVGTNCTITGWGKLGEDKEGPDVLHAAKVPIVSHELCEAAYKKENEPITKQMICAGHIKGGIDSCQGDSGGPLVCKSANGGRYKQAGVVSWAIGCAQEELYGVNTKLSTMRNWIESKVNTN